MICIQYEWTPLSANYVETTTKKNLVVCVPLTHLIYLAKTKMRTLNHLPVGEPLARLQRLLFFIFFKKKTGVRTSIKS